MKRLFRQSSTNTDFLSLRMSVAFLLTGYTTVFLFSPMMLHHAEHDHVEHQRDTCEKDPCHISIYHAGKDGGCNHKFHFTESTEKCRWCDVVLVHQVRASNAIFNLHRIDFPQQEILSDEGVIICITVTQTDRGPPVSFHI